MKKDFSESEYEILENFICRSIEESTHQVTHINKLREHIKDDYENEILEIDEYKFLSDLKSLEHLCNVFRDLEIAEDEIGQLEQQQLCWEEKIEDLKQGKIICYEEMYAI